jgi:hypothetical protein
MKVGNMKVPTTLIIEDNKINLPQVARRVWHYPPVLAASLQNDPLRQQGQKGMFGAPLKPVLFPVRDGLTHQLLYGNAPPGLRAMQFYDLWKKGLGPSEYIFGPNHHWTQRMRDAHGVTRARQYLAGKYRGKLPEGGTLSAYRPGFGPSDFVNAGFDSIEQTIGNYRVDVWVRTFDIRIRLYNVAGRTSFYAGSIIDKAQEAGVPLKKISGVKSGPERDITLVLWWDEAIPQAAR